MPRPITTYDDFFKALTAARTKKGYKFVLLDNTHVVRRNGRLFRRCAIYHQTPATSLMLPIAVVYDAWYNKTPDKTAIFVSTQAAREIGLSSELEFELTLAAVGNPAALPDLRARMLRATDLTEKEVPYVF